MSSQPLYRQLEQRPYPAYQHMDIASIQWLIENAKPQRTPIQSVVPHYIAFPLNDLLLKRSWFVKPELALGIHGIRHLIRVALYAWIIVQEQSLSESLDKKELSDFMQVALLHDVRRVDDNADLDHGHRSADWIKQHLPNIPTLIVSAVEYHVDDAMPSNIPAKTASMLKILKAADALDRFRLPKIKWWPDPARIPLPINNELLEFCKYVTLSTEQITCESDSFEQVKDMMAVWLRQEKLI